MSTPALLPPLPRDQRQIDAQHLKLLSVFHFVLAALSLVGLGFLALHWFIVNSVFSHANAWETAKSGPPPPEFFALFKWFYIVAGFFVVTSGVANLVSGFMIRRRRGRIFSFIVAGLNCLAFPFGPILGVFTFIVLLRDSVEELYAVTASS